MVIDSATQGNRPISREYGLVPALQESQHAFEEAQSQSTAATLQVEETQQLGSMEQGESVDLDFGDGDEETILLTEAELAYMYGE